MSFIMFTDTETTGLSLEDEIWEFACILRDTETGVEDSHQFFIDHDEEKAARLPEPFLSDYHRRYCFADAITPIEAAKRIYDLTYIGPHIVGAVPNFDTERLAIFLRAYGYEPAWHYHLHCVENLAVGYLAARGIHIALPWDSEELSRLVGVEPDQFERHTAMGDVLWARAMYDAVMRGTH